MSLLVVTVTACGDDGDHAAATRADQVRSAAEDAGLPEDVVDLLGLAARGATETFQVTYPGDDGTSLVISQAPPDRRIDVVAGDRIVRSQVVRGGVGYRCEPPDGDPTAALECRRSQGALDGPGAFTDEALDTFTGELVEALDDIDLSVETRTIADVDATCLVAAPKAGPTDGTGPGVEEICVSDEGAQLLVDAAGERLVASGYTTQVPEGTFDT